MQFDEEDESPPPGWGPCDCRWGVQLAPGDFSEFCIYKQNTVLIILIHHHHHSFSSMIDQQREVDNQSLASSDTFISSGFLV